MSAPALATGALVRPCALAHDVSGCSSDCPPREPAYLRRESGASSRTVVAAVTLWVAAVAGGIVASSHPVPTDTPAHVSPVSPWIACVQEDSPGPCYWHAGIRGNGYGTSFVRYADGRMSYGEPYGMSS